MTATIKQAENNERNLTIAQTGYGRWKISCEYRGKTISTATTDSSAIDDYRSEFGEKDNDGYNRRKAGYITLVNEIINDNIS